MVNPNNFSFFINSSNVNPSGVLDCSFSAGDVLSLCSQYSNHLILIAIIPIVVNLIVVFAWGNFRDLLLNEIFLNYPNEILALNIGMFLMILMYVLLQRGVIS